jgi:hypothetical protein
MNTPNHNKRQQLVGKLKELFRLDHLDEPDFDFSL